MFWDFVFFLQKRTRVASFQPCRVRLRYSQIPVFASSVTGSRPTQQSTVDHTYQPDIRLESVNSVNPVSHLKHSKACC